MFSSVIFLTSTHPQANLPLHQILGLKTTETAVGADLDKANPSGFCAAPTRFMADNKAKARFETVPTKLLSQQNSRANGKSGFEDHAPLVLAKNLNFLMGCCIKVMEAGNWKLTKRQARKSAI
ncbi:MAG: hypothetical protein N2116_00825 [Armatimonadetes bacterium]|nr:hypothetical protein [Armatimonadota bacterium]